MIENRVALQAAVDAVFNDIAASCVRCDFPDCLGYMWLLPSEEKDVLDAGLPVVQINGDSGPLYLDTFRRDPSGAVRVGGRGPRCPFRDASGKCTVHSGRPLVCHLYPLSLDWHEDQLSWVLHTDCQYVMDISHRHLLEDLTVRLKNVTSAVSPSLREEIVEALARHATITTPVKQDCYVVLSAV